MKRGVLIAGVLLLASGCLFSTGSDNDVDSGSLVDATSDAGLDMTTPKDAGGGSDLEVPTTCGDGALQADETCDPMLPDDSPGACPKSCDDREACTLDRFVGSALTCDLACQSVPIAACESGDGCCPADCGPDNDTDCDSSAVCGDAVVTGAERCDPGIAADQDGACPMSPADCSPMQCERARIDGTASRCTAECAFNPISVCEDDDGCCAPGCDSINDNDCTAQCNNGVIDPGELCDGNCPVIDDCDDSNPCTTDTLIGSANTCDAECVNEPITTCSLDPNSSDQCCPSNCTSTTDVDCSMSCGDGIIDAPAETCDGNCPMSCNDNDACTADEGTGSPANCNVECTNTAITACRQTPDGCCPASCNSNNDTDCSPQCGNGVTEAGEECDGNTCPTDCDDGDACTADSLTGAAADCDAECRNTVISSCMNGDGCCPSGCNATNDDDCGSVCGNGIVEPGEACDGNCPQSCNDGNACTNDVRSGSAAQCNVSCSYSNITSCIDGDGCCPTNSGCTALNDDDCSASCGNGATEGSEKCDGSDCPTAADCAAIGPCHELIGSASQCTAECVQASNCTPCELPPGNCRCSTSEICSGGRCQTSTNGQQCDLRCDPDLYCDGALPGSTCDLGSGVCEQCQQAIDCMFYYQMCDMGMCSYATSCERAADPDDYCVNEVGLPQCDLNTGTCVCLDDADCGYGEECFDGQCVFIDSCEQSNNPDIWCQNQGFPTGYICVESLGRCLKQCTPGDNCDCEDQVYQSCVENADQSYCDDITPSHCNDACDPDGFCQELYFSIDAKCDVTGGPGTQGDGCINIVGTGDMGL